MLPAQTLGEGGLGDSLRPLCRAFCAISKVKKKHLSTLFWFHYHKLEVDHNYFILFCFYLSDIWGVLQIGLWGSTTTTTPNAGVGSSKSSLSTAYFTSLPSVSRSTITSSNSCPYTSVGCRIGSSPHNQHCIFVLGNACSVPT